MTLLNDTRLQDFMARVGEFGRQEGKGKNAKPSYALDVIKMAHEGVIGADHADQVWGKFAEASAKTKGVERDRLNTAKTDKVRISETGKLIACGVIAAFDPAEMMERAVTIINADNDARGSTYQNMVVVARAQLKSKAQALTDDEIRQAIRPADPEAKDEQDHLQALVKRMKKLHDGDEKDPTFKAYPSPELQAAIKSLEQRLANLVSAEETAKMFELAAAKGFTLAPVQPASENETQDAA